MSNIAIPIPEYLPVDKLRTDGGTQPRAGIDTGVVDDYAEQITGVNEWPFPPVVAYYDGDSYWLADGFHRVAAARIFREREQLDGFTIPVEVHQGERRDAILYSVGANAQHGLRRSNEDKRRAVLRLLNDEEWQKWSDREIARRCHVSMSFVGKLRLSLHSECSESDTERVYRTKHGKPATMQTANIGKSARREELTPGLPKSTLRQGADGRTVDTADIGRSSLRRSLSSDYSETERAYTTKHPEHDDAPVYVSDDAPVYVSDDDVDVSAPVRRRNMTAIQKASVRNLLRTIHYGVGYFKPHPAARELGVEEEWRDAWEAIQVLVKRLEEIGQ